MILYSTNNTSRRVSLREAVIKGLPEDNGLFMPLQIPLLPGRFIRQLADFSFVDIAYEISSALLQGVIPQKELSGIIERAINFPAPLVKLDEQKYVLELFHGPSLAFKDFGARFMAQLMAYFNRGEERELLILVATSGDTGGAVAAGFYKTPGIRVVILYPSGKVSFLQEKQLTTLGHNITALEVDGTFDDCQALVKSAFLDSQLNAAMRLSSANSINIARLIPQTFYYFEAYKQLKKRESKLIFCVPSGNFGNLTAGLLAQRMGLSVHHFIAATNVNDVVPEYLKSGVFNSRLSIPTLSNAMDVGNPSNFTRILDLFGNNSGKPLGSTWNMMKAEISGFAFNDEQTKDAVRDVYEKYAYLIDPHGAVGYLALKAYQRQFPDTLGVILETAHPAKFKNEIEMILGRAIDVPGRLAGLAKKIKYAVRMENQFAQFKDWLLDNYS